MKILDNFITALVIISIVGATTLLIITLFSGLWYLSIITGMLAFTAYAIGWTQYDEKFNNPKN